MKFLKIFSVLVACLFTMSTFATTKATITITSDAHPSYCDHIDLEVDATYPTDFSSSSLKLHAPMTGGAVDVYAEGTSNDYCIVKMNDIDGLKIVFKANIADDNYTMTFSGLDGDAIMLKKGTDGEPFGMDAAKQFSCTHSTSCEFYVVMPKTYTRELPVGKWGTICFPYEISNVEGAAVYSVKAKNSESTLLALEVAPDTLVKGAIYIFNATEDEQVFTYAGEAATDAADANGCYGVFAADGITISDAGAYVLNGDALVNATVGFTHVGQYRAWFKVSEITTEGFNAPGRIILKIAGQATELETIEAANADGKMLINGQLIIIKDGVRYNAMGAKL